MSDDAESASANPPTRPAVPPSGIGSWEDLRSEIRRRSLAWNATITAARLRVPSVGTGRLADSAIKLLGEVERAWRRVFVHRLQEVKLPFQDAKDLRAWGLAQLDILDIVRLASPWFEGRYPGGRQLENVYTDEELIDLAKELLGPAGVSENLRRQIIRIRWETHPCAALWSADCLRCVMRQADFHLRNLPGEDWPERPAENADEPTVRRFLNQVIDWCDRQAKKGTITIRSGGAAKAANAEERRQLIHQYIGAGITCPEEIHATLARERPDLVLRNQRGTANDKGREYIEVRSMVLDYNKHRGDRAEL